MQRNADVANQGCVRRQVQKALDAVSSPCTYAVAASLSDKAPTIEVGGLHDE
jgi:hypothetical protein